MVAGAIAGNISAEATTPTGNSFAEAMRGSDESGVTPILSRRWPQSDPHRGRLAQVRARPFSMSQVTYKAVMEFLHAV
jgi:hypothetical protein